MDVGAVLSREEIEALDGVDLDRALLAAEARARASQREMADILDVAEQRKRHRADGHRNVRGWLLAFTGISGPEATARIQTMRAMRELPHAADAFRAGSIGVCQMRLLARLSAHPRVGDLLPAVERKLVRKARTQPFNRFRIEAHDWQTTADADGVNRDHDRIHRSRNAATATMFGRTQLDAHWGAAQGGDIVKILQAFEQAEYDHDWAITKAEYGDRACEALMPRTRAQRRADAIHAIFLAAASCPAGSKAPEPVVNIHIDLPTFTRRLRAIVTGEAVEDDPTRFETACCFTDDGEPISPDHAIAAALIGRVRRIVYDTNGVVVDLGRTSRLYRGSARRAILLANRRCAWEGCDAPAATVDHTTEWTTNGGRTDQDNGAPCCNHHNPWRTKHGYRIVRQPDATYHTLRPDGTRINSPPAA
jgi:hypothetical protein